MTEQQIKNYFSLDKESVEPLYKQLEQRFEKFIVSNPPGTKFPAERKLASVLQIDRTTIQNALSRFLDEEVIVRNGRRGTFIANNGISISDDLPESDFNPMALGDHDYNWGLDTIDIMLYENLPTQRKCWEAIVSLFNKTHTNCKAKISWVPSNILSNNYVDYIKEKSPDVFQAYLGFPFKPIMANLPEDLTEELCGEKYNQEHLWNRKFNFMKQFAPVYCSAPLLFWNNERIQKLGISNLNEEIRQKGFGAVLENPAFVNDESIDSNLIYSYIVKRGLPQKGWQEKTFSRDIFKWLNKLRDNGICKATLPQRALKISEEFIAGRRTFLILHPSEFIYRKDEWKFEFGEMILPRPKGWVVHSGTVCFGIYKDAVNYEGAARFIEFAVSDKAQELITENMHSLAYLKKANNSFIHHFKSLTENEISEILKSVRSFWHSPEPMIDAGYYMAPICQFIANKVNIDQAVEQAKEILAKEYQLYCQRHICMD